MDNSTANMEISSEDTAGVRLWENKELAGIVNAMTLTLGTTGYAVVDRTWHAHQSVVPFTRIYAVLEGQAFLSCDSQEFIMEPGMVYVIPAGVACSYHCEGSMRKLYFHVNLDRPDHYDILWGYRKIGSFPAAQSMLEEMLRHYRAESYLDAVLLRTYLLQILAEYLRRHGSHQTSVRCYSEVVTQTIDWIHQNLSARLRIDDLAAKRFVSRTCLTDIFRKETGVTLGKYIDEQLIIEAQQRLYLTNASIGTISRDLGFCDQFYFARRFKQLCGFTPMQYRNKSKQG